MAMPFKDTLLIAWGANFDQKGSSSPVTYSLSPAQMASFHDAYVAYSAAYNAVAQAREGGVRSKPLTSIKDSAKTELLKIGRELYSIVQDSNSVSPANKADIGVVVRKTNPTPIPAPAEAPGISIVSTFGNTVRLRLINRANPTRRGRPVDVIGALIFTAEGPDAPTTQAGWKFEQMTADTVVNVNFPASTLPGARVWFTARWFNNRKQTGPVTQPQGVNLPGGIAMAA